MKTRRWIQVFFLLFFAGVMISGRLPVWMLVFAGSFVAAFLFSRFYCGWICPINTLTEVLNWIYQKKGIKRKPVPQWIKPPAFRFVILAGFIAVMVLTLRTGIRLPVLPALLAVGVILTLVYVPALWHRYLCPYGTLLSLPGFVARNKFMVITNDCTGCGLCQKSCPAEAVQLSFAPKKAAISASLCLACTACAQVCPTNAIVYGRRSGNLQLR